jgi:hypothetical protein
MSDGISFDFTNDEAHTGFEPLPTGTYAFNVTDPKFGETQAGKPKLQVTLAGLPETPAAGNKQGVTFTFEKPFARRMFKAFLEAVEDESGNPIFADFNVDPGKLAGDDDKPSQLAGAIVSARVIERTWTDEDEAKNSFKPLMNPVTGKYNRIEVYLPTKRKGGTVSAAAGKKNARP